MAAKKLGWTEVLSVGWPGGGEAPRPRKCSESSSCGLLKE